MIADIFTAITDIVSGVIGVFTEIFTDTGIIAVFYDETTGLTFVGLLVLLLFGFGLVRWGLKWVAGLLSMRKG